MEKAKNISELLDIYILNFNETLTDDVVSFEQSGPDRLNYDVEGQISNGPVSG